VAPTAIATDGFDARPNRLIWGYVME
jgi:hypothetical protein